LFTGNGNIDSYLLIGLTRGQLVFSFNLPNKKRGFQMVSTSNHLNDNKWHKVKIERTKKKATLYIDDSIHLSDTFDDTNYVGLGKLQTDGYLRLGGYRNLPKGLHRSLYQGFSGCIKGFKVDNRFIDLIKYNLNKPFYPNECY
jgi:hypothetical protein